jgi:hypothetical protein
MGDEKLQQFYKTWKVITTGVMIPFDDRILRDIFMERIRTSKKLQADIHEFDRMRDDGAKNNLKWLTDSMYRMLQRERRLDARALQTKRIQSGASLTIDNILSSAALAFEKGEGKTVRVRAKGSQQGKILTFG